MESPKALHEQAMALYSKAQIAKIEGRISEWEASLREAFNLEKRAAILLNDRLEAEPTRSMLFSSAASLAVQLKLFREAEKLAALGLAGDAPEDIAVELREMLEDINFKQHLSLSKVQLSPSEMQLSIAQGNSVSSGVALWDDVAQRINAFVMILYKTIDRTAKRPFGDRRKPEVMGQKFPLYIQPGYSHSYSVVLRFGEVGNQSSLFDEFGIDKSIDESLACLELIDSGADDELAARIDDPDYFKDFVSWAKRLAPDGDKIRGLGITVLRKGEEKAYPMRRIREEISLIKVQNQPTNNMDASGQAQIVRYEGVLDAAFASKNRIKIKTKGSKSHSISIDVADGFIDIVRDNFGKEVIVECEFQNKNNKLLDISTL